MRVSNLIAIVGRPNVGKSALFNRIVKRRIAIVHDQPGVTRDRVSVEAEWHGKSFTLVDTGGIGLLRREKSEDVIVKAALEQVEIAIEAASAIIFVVNVQEGVVPLDREVAQKLRSSGKPILIAINKVDTSLAEKNMDEFFRLGFEKMFPVSAIHGEGIQNLMDAATAFLPAPNPAPEVQDTEVLEAPGEATTPAPRKKGPLRLAIVGRPNVGKSSIINALTKSERVIVSPIPGTTRDSVDVPFEVETEGVREKYVLVDTAGIRKTRSIDDSVEFFSVQMCIRDSDKFRKAAGLRFQTVAQFGVFDFARSVEQAVNLRQKNAPGKNMRVAIAENRLKLLDRTQRTPHSRRQSGETHRLLLEAFREFQHINEIF